MPVKVKGSSVIMFSILEGQKMFSLFARVVAGCWDFRVFVFLPSLTANKALEDKLQEMNGVTDKTVGELKDRIQGLEKELDNANELLSSSKLRGQWS